MKKKRGKGFSNRKVAIIIVLFALAIFFNAFAFLSEPKSPTGYGTQATGSVVFEILGDLFINITHPYDDNYTYNFSENLTGPYYLDLNLTYNYNPGSWLYSLYDLKHNKWVYQDVSFVPNFTQVGAVRWGNRLDVFASTLDGQKNATDNVTFFIWVKNTAPIIGPIDNPVYACESTSLWYKFYAEDNDEEFLSVQLTGGGSSFFASSLPPLVGNRTNMVVFSGNLEKGVGAGADIHLNEGNISQLVNIEVNDSNNHAANKSTNITLLEVNNLPIIDNIGVQTVEVWTQGKNSTFEQFVKISDIEYDAPFGWGELNVNVTIKNESGNLVDLFNITRYNSTHFLINFTANSSTPLGIYDIWICANDTGILNPHPDLLSACGMDGGINTVCEYFELTITNRNRPPTIVDYYPENDSVINVSGGFQLYFNITKFDPDGTTPDSYWFVENYLMGYMYGNFTDKFYYKFPCGVGGNKTVKAEITDGQYNDSVIWQFNVKTVACVEDGGGGSSEGGITPTCEPLWGCDSWRLCQHAKTSLENGLLSGADYRNITNECLSKDLDETNCGFQIRTCFDLNKCNTTRYKPGGLKWCHYTANPSCDDGIQNCHSGECELLIDCGGPCKACPNCDDKVKNQGEEGVDCGGPCPWKCPVEVPLLKRKEFVYGLLLLLLIIIVIIIIKLIRVLKYRKGISSERIEKQRFK